MHSSDDLGLVLRVDFLLQKALTQKCRQIFPEIDQVYKNISSSICCSLLQLVQAPKAVWQPCRIAIRIRNEFAHGNQKKLTLQHAQRIAEDMGPEFKAFANPDNLSVSLPSGEQEPVPDEFVPNRLYLMLAALQYSEIIALKGHFSTEVSHDGFDTSKSWELLSSEIDSVESSSK